MRFFRTSKSVDQETREKFADSEPVEIMFQQLNDCFDIMNGRCPRDGIKAENWQGKKKVYYFHSSCSSWLVKCVYELQKLK